MHSRDLLGDDAELRAPEQVGDVLRMNTGRKTQERRRQVSRVAGVSVEEASQRRRAAKLTLCVCMAATPAILAELHARGKQTHAT